MNVYLSKNKLCSPDIREIPFRQSEGGPNKSKACVCMETHFFPVPKIERENGKKRKVTTGRDFLNKQPRTLFGKEKEKYNNDILGGEGEGD